MSVLSLTIAAPAVAQSDVIQADRPGVADSSSVIGKGRLQLETGLQWEKRASEFSTFLPTLFRVGLTKRLEARVEGDTYTTVTDHDLHERGLTPISLGFKALLTQPGGAGASAAIIAGVTPAWGTGVFASESVSADVRLVADFNLSEHWSLTPNAGLAWTDGEQRAFVPGLFAVTLGYQPRQRVQWFVDAAAEVPEAEEGVASVVIDGGVAFIPRRNWQFDVSAGKRLHGDTAPNPFISVGVSLRSRR